MNRMEAALSTEAGAAELVAAVGVGSEPDVARAYNDLVDMLGDDDADLADLQSVVSDASSDPEIVVACLQSLGVFATAASGRYRLEPVLAGAWRLR
jgi:hypothetical protein